MHVLRRARDVWKSRGAHGFALFLWSKLYRRRHDLLFEAEAVAEHGDRQWNSVERLLCVSRENLPAALTSQLMEQVFSGEGAEYLEGLKRGDLLFVVVDADGNVLHHSFVLFDTRSKVLLGESVYTPLFAHCVTRVDARGKHLYRRVLRHGLAVFARTGYSRAIVNCDPDNLASVAGIQGAGFRLVKTLDTKIVLSCLGWQKVRERDGTTRRRIFAG